MLDKTWQECMEDKLSDAHAAAQNHDYDEAAMWAQAALEAWQEGSAGDGGGK